GTSHSRRSDAEGHIRQHLVGYLHCRISSGKAREEWHPTRGIRLAGEEPRFHARRYHRLPHQPESETAGIPRHQPSCKPPSVPESPTSAEPLPARRHHASKPGVLSQFGTSIG